MSGGLSGERKLTNNHMIKDPRIRVCPPQPDVKGEICVGGVCFQWPEPPIGFKPQSRGWPRPDFAVPVTMCGGNFGRQLIYEDDTDQTYFENEPPLWWLYPNLANYAFGGMEEIVEGFEDRRLLTFAKKYNRMVYAGIIEGEQINLPAATVSLNDLYMDGDEDAFTRAAYLVNLPAQPEGVKIVKLYQANSVESFNKYLDQIKDEGWAGAWVRPNDSVWGEAEYFVNEEL